MSEYNYWTTKNRSVIKITDMSTEHLKNTIDFIEENLAIRQLRFANDEKEWYNSQMQGADINDIIPYPFDCAAESPSYKRLKKYKKIMELELKSRK